jgi:NADH-quinone oxidoreductase subunit A
VEGAVMTAYLPILILLVIAGGFAVTMATVVSDGIGPRRYNRAKLDAYECGIEPTPLPAGSAGRFPIKFYLTAMLFIVFDVEIIFLYPWAQSAVPLGVFGLVEVAVFLLTVGAVYVYVWRRGGLDWD